MGIHTYLAELPLTSRMNKQMCFGEIQWSDINVTGLGRSDDRENRSERDGRSECMVPSLSKAKGIPIA